MPFSVFIVEDHPLVVEAYEMLIEEEADFSVCGAAATYEEAVTRIPPAQPDLVLIDISLKGQHGKSGLDVLRFLRTQESAAKTLVISAHEPSLYAQRALALGASGYISKQSLSDQLLNVARRVLDGDIVVSG